jgi:hypothetical protein
MPALFIGVASNSMVRVYHEGFGLKGFDNLCRLHWDFFARVEEEGEASGLEDSNPVF